MSKWKVTTTINDLGYMTCTKEKAKSEDEAEFYSSPHCDTWIDIVDSEEEADEMIADAKAENGES